MALGPPTRWPSGSKPSHPLLISLANTKEPLFLVNRSGNRPSHEGAPAALHRAIELCQSAGFRDVLLRGDTDFSMTAHLDRWDAAGVRFVFGYDANRTFVERANGLDDSDYQELVRKADEHFRKRREKPARIKEEIVRERGYFNKQLVSEDTAEFDHKPTQAEKAYRIVVLASSSKRNGDRSTWAGASATSSSSPTTASSAKTR